MATLPSSFWKFSSTATSVRPTARPEPLSVCTSSFLPCADLNRVCIRRAWKASQFETELISRYMSCAGTQTLHHRTHQKSDTDGDSVGNRPPGRQLESSEGEDYPETGAIPEVIGKPGKNGRRRWTQSKAIEQQYAHEFRKVAGHEAQSKSGVAYHFEGDGR